MFFLNCDTARQGGSKGCEMMNHTWKIVFMAFLRLTLVLMSMLMVCMLSGCSGNSAGKSEKDYSNIVENPNIAIPGYESISFHAEEKKQSVSFYNPDVNTCYFKLSLVLVDGTEEGTVLWTSDLLEPGEEIKSIELEKELESGDYTATLKYECFSLKDHSPLNGSDIVLTIQVR